MRLFDASAIGLSSLCLVHCLALPVLAAALPSLGMFAHAEWVHWVFIGLALPATAMALWSASRTHGLPIAVVVLAVCGLAGLTLGVLEIPSERLATPVTVAGSLLLVSAHTWNWLRQVRAHRHHPLKLAPPDVGGVGH